MTNQGVECKRHHGGERDTFGTSPCVEYFGRDDPTERATSERERDVVKPGHEDETPACSVVITTGRGVDRSQDGGNDEENHVGQIGTDQNRSTPSSINDEHATCLGEQGKHTVNTLVFECIGSVDTNMGEEGDGVVLDGRNTGHLDRSLESHAEKKTTETGSMAE